MIDLSSYRQRIGSFYQFCGKTKTILHKSCKRTALIDKSFYFKSVFSIFLYICLTTIIIICSQHGYNSESRLAFGPVIENYNSPWNFEIHFWTIWTHFSGNFMARYFNGNGRENGIRVYHLNVRKLQHKVSEIKRAPSSALNL